MYGVVLWEEVKCRSVTWHLFDIILESISDEGGGETLQFSQRTCLVNSKTLSYFFKMGNVFLVTTFFITKSIIIYLSYYLLTSGEFGRLRHFRLDLLPWDDDEFPISGIHLISI